MESFLLQLFIFLAAAAIAVPLAKKLGLGSVLGYLIAGIIIGPFGLSFTGDVEAVMHFTEFGVVMMLFLVGLELKPSLLWKMRTPILGMGGTQVVLTATAISAVGFYFLPWQQAIAIGLALSLSSTAIVLQTLKEKGIMNSNAGRSVFSVLLFQDLAVIPMLALLPFLATFAVDSSDHHESVLWDISTLPIYSRLAVVILAISAIFVIAKFASKTIFRAVASTGVREIFVATVLAMVVGISLLMTTVGLSPALGTFLAGVVLADSEYRHELESDIEPFKGLLLGIFFISIGASFNFTLISNNIALIASLTAGLLLIKWLVLAGTSIVFKVPKKERSFFAIALPQGGEFAFVLFQFSKNNGVLESSTIDPLISAVAISMFLTPLLFILHDKLIASKNADKEIQQEPDKIDKTGHKVILAGFGRLGTELGRFLIAAGIKPVILDYDTSNIDVLRKYGFEVFYGDATRLDLLEAAGASEAELLIIAMKDANKTKDLVELCKKHFPHLKIISNAYDRGTAYQLMDVGVEQVRMATFGTALALGQDALKQLGYEPYEAYRMMRIFKGKDEEMMPELYKNCKKGEDKYISFYQQHNEILSQLMEMDFKAHMDEADEVWTTAKLKKSEKGKTTHKPN